MLVENVEKEQFAVLNNNVRNESRFEQKVFTMRSLLIY